MWETLANVLDTPVLLFIAWQLWKIKTNDLPHIQVELAKMNTRLDAHIDREEGVLAEILEEVKG